MIVVHRRNTSKGTQAILLVCVQEIVEDHCYYSSAISISEENNPKDAQGNTGRKKKSELLTLVVKENGALSEADGSYCTYSFGGRLDLLGWRALQYVGQYVASMRMMQAAWREVGVSSCALLHRAIARSDTRCVVRAYTCVYIRKFREVTSTRMCFHRGLHRRIAISWTHGNLFRNTLFVLLDPEILSAASSILPPLKILHSSAKK